MKDVKRVEEELVVTEGRTSTLEVALKEPAGRAEVVTVIGTLIIVQVRL